MKRLLLISFALIAWLMLVCFSCSDEGTKGRFTAAEISDTTMKSNSAEGKPVNGGQTNTQNQGLDTTLRYKTAVQNNAPDQSRIDSIKNAKTKKKK